MKKLLLLILVPFLLVLPVVLADEILYLEDDGVYDFDGNSIASEDALTDHNWTDGESGTRYYDHYGDGLFYINNSDGLYRYDLEQNFTWLKLNYMISYTNPQADSIFEVGFMLHNHTTAAGQYIGLQMYKGLSYIRWKAEKPLGGDGDCQGDTTGFTYTVGAVYNITLTVNTSITNKTMYVSINGTEYNPCIETLALPSNISRVHFGVQLSTMDAILGQMRLYITGDENPDATADTGDVQNNTQPIVTVTYPSNFTTLGNNTDYPLLIYGTVTVQNGTLYNTTVNSTNWYNKGNRSNFNFTFNGSMTEGLWVLNVSSNSTHGNRSSKIIEFRIDVTQPATFSTLYNSTLIYAYDNLTFDINMTDSQNITRFNISTETYKQEFTNLDTTKFIYNASIDVSTFGIGKHILTVAGCDDALNCNTTDYAYYIYNYTVFYESRVPMDIPTDIKLSINYKDIILNGTAIMSYNTTSYVINNKSANNYINFSTNITPPYFSTYTNYINLSFNYTLNNTWFSTINYTQTVDNVVLGWYGNVSNVSAINFSFWDELNNSQITNANIEGVFTYLGSNTFSPKLTNTNNLSVAIYPTGSVLEGSYIVYFSGTGYTERRYSEPDATYNNNTQLIRLYMLQTAEGGYATFRIEDIYSNIISGVTCTMQKSIGGSTVTIEKQTSDATGLASFFVNPDDDYTFTFSKTGYETYTATIRPTTSEIYTVTLGSVEEETVPSYATGILYTFSPSNTVLNNQTNYTFSFNMSSTYWDITDCYLTLKNATDTLATATGSYTTESCYVSTIANTGRQTIIINEVTYELNDTTVEVVSMQYAVKYTYTGEFSLKSFIDDIRSFAEAGFNDFTRMIIAFIVIFSIVAFMSSNYFSLRDPEILLILAWVLVLFFSYLEFFTINLEAIPDIAGLRQYLLFYLFTLGAGSYIIRRHI